MCKTQLCGRAPPAIMGCPSLPWKCKPTHAHVTVHVSQDTVFTAFAGKALCAFLEHTVFTLCRVRGTHTQKNCFCRNGASSELSPDVLAPKARACLHLRACCHPPPCSLGHNRPFQSPPAALSFPEVSMSLKQQAGGPGSQDRVCLSLG